MFDGDFSFSLGKARQVCSERREAETDDRIRVVFFFFCVWEGSVMEGMSWQPFFFNSLPFCLVEM